MNAGANECGASAVFAWHAVIPSVRLRYQLVNSCVRLVGQGEREVRPDLGASAVRASWIDRHTRMLTRVEYVENPCRDSPPVNPTPRQRAATMKRTSAGGAGARCARTRAKKRKGGGRPPAHARPWYISPRLDPVIVFTLYNFVVLWVCG